MSSWTDKKGFPVLIRSDDDPNELKIYENKGWEIPIFYKKENASEEIHVELMTGDTLKINQDQPVILNPNRYGFYRIIDTTPKPFLTNKVEKLKHLSDLFAAFELGRVDISVYLNFVKLQILDASTSGGDNLETSNIVLTELLDHLSMLSTIFASNNISKMVAKSYSNIENLLKVDSNIRSRMTALVALSYGIEESSLDKLNLDSKMPKLICSIKQENSPENFYQKYDQADATEKQLIGQAICKAEKNSEKCLTWINSDSVADCDKPYYLTTLAAQNSSTRDYIWNFLVENQEKINEKYKNGIFLLPRLYKGVLELFNESRIVEEFCGDHKLEKARQAINQGFDSVLLNERIFESNRGIFEGYEF